MASGQNEGVRVLEDFVCDAIHSAASSKIVGGRGRNEGISVTCC
jgi:hypothetical protein